MKKYLVILCLIVSSAYGEENYPQAVYEAASAVYQVKVKSSSSLLSFLHPSYRGTGFFIAPNLFVTNFHVIQYIQDASGLSLYSNGDLAPIQVERVLAVSLPYDLALIQTKGESPVYLSESHLSSERLFTMGYPKDRGLQYHHSFGSIRNWDDTWYSIFFNFIETAGASGSPVVDSSGRAVGVLFGSIGFSKAIVGSHWIEALKEGQIGTQCRVKKSFVELVRDSFPKIKEECRFGMEELCPARTPAAACIKRETIKTKKMVKKFLAGQPVERKDLGLLHVTKDKSNAFDEEEEKTVFVWKMAEEFNDAAAQYSVGVGFNKQGRRTEAIEWFKLAAEQGHPDAQYNTGHLLIRQEQEQNQFEEAIEWLEFAVEQERLGEVASWLELAAEQGHPKAQSDLGVILLTQGQHEEAIRWFRLSAEQGNLQAQYNLGGGLFMDLQFLEYINWLASKETWAAIHSQIFD